MIIKVLRWLLVFPSAILGAWLAFVACRLLAVFLTWSSGESQSAAHAIVVVEGISNGALGAGFVYCGTVMAPTRKSIVAIVLAFVASCAIIALCVDLWWPGWRLIVGNVAMLAGAIYVAYLAKTDTASFDRLWLMRGHSLAP